MRDWGARVAAVRFTIYIIYPGPMRAIERPGGDPRTERLIHIELPVPLDERALCPKRAVSNDTLRYLCDKSDIKTCGILFQFQRREKGGKALGGIQRVC